MQDREFNDLIQGKPYPKWAEMDSPKSDMDQLQKQLNLTLIPGESKKDKRAWIKDHEVPIPDHIRDAIQKFVLEEREKKVSERAIRRAVKRKWNIYVV